MMEREGSDNLDNLVGHDRKAAIKKKIILILIPLIIISIIVIIIVLVVSRKNDDKSDSSEKYKFSINSVNLPEGIIYEGHAIYSKKGHIIFLYKKEDDSNTYIGVMNEDGSKLKVLWSGVWKNFYQSNGIRLMPFDDNKKILTGDYILECFPDIDNCQNSSLLPVIYPPEVVNIEGLNYVWSEIIVSPDEHIGWTTLSSVYDAVNFLGKLEKNENNYTISNIQIISSLGFIEYENQQEGIFKHRTIRGGEIKQFTNGGEALTLAGAGGESALAKSVFQNLVGEENYPLTQFPGYEETTIISPDGKLGLTMTTRFSLKTSSYILGYMPRPLSIYTISKMNRYAYFYGVQEVRKKRKGNIGPALIDIEESKKNNSYMGYDLHEEGWAFSSPLSWHPNSKKGMFSEIKQNSEKVIKRIRIVNLENYKPGKILENKKTPDNISYAKTLQDLNDTALNEAHGYFKGKGGIMIFNKTETWSKSGYFNYTEDNKTFYNGYEKFEFVGSPYVGKLTSNITMSGEKDGIMDLTLTMTYAGNILFDQSYGYVEYNGKKLTIEDSFLKNNII